MWNVIMLSAAFFIAMQNLIERPVIMWSVIMLNVVMLNVVMLNVVMLNVVMLNVVMLNVVMLNMVMLNVVMLNVIMLIVAAPKQHAQNFSFLGKSFLLLESSNYVSSEPQQKKFCICCYIQNGGFSAFGGNYFEKSCPNDFTFKMP
jgi:hypothetical protein